MLEQERPGWSVTPISIDSEVLKQYCYVLRGVPGATFLFGSKNPGVNDFPVGLRLPRNLLPVLGITPPSDIDSSVRPGAPFTLRPYQKEAIEFIQNREGTILAHDLGTGKTSTSIAASESPICILCPVSAIEVWRLELALWGLDCQVLRGKKVSIKEISKEVHAYIIPYSATNWCGLFNRVHPVIKPHTLILDEAHYLQKKSLIWTKNIKTMYRERTILLTATPIRNRLSSLYSLLDVATPGAWGYHDEFRKRYCGAIKGEYGGWVDGTPTNTDELRGRLKDVIHIQNWADPSMHGLRPPLERHIIPLNLSRDERVLITTMSMNYLNERGHKAGQTLVLDGKLREAVGKIKARYTAELMPKMLDRHSRIVCWFWYKKSLDAFRSAIPKVVEIDVVTGSTGPRVRERIMDEWRFGEPHTPRVLLATLPAFSAAVSLTSADAEIFVEYSDAPLDVQQAEKRIHRPGSKHPKVYAYYMRAEGTKEDRVINNILSKIEEIEELFGEDPQTIQIREIAEEG